MTMFSAAYLVARLLWVPLIACWTAAKGAPGRGVIWVPIVAGVAATIWESMIPVQMNIRLDLMLVGPVLMVAEGFAGVVLALAYWKREAGTKGSTAIAAAAALCIGASAFFVIAWGFSTKESQEQARRHDEGSRRYFEAAFRDDETQRASFGKLEGTRWAGYYVGDPPHPSYGHLVVNADGDYFQYSEGGLYERRGRTQPDSADAALLTGKRIYVGVPVADVEIRDLGDGRLRFRERAGIASEATFVKRPPPRFPRPPSPSDKVVFKGVFSGIHDDSSAKWVGLAQVWLWESDGRWWGVWLRGTHSREHAQPVFANNKADVSCADRACTTLEVHTEGGRRETMRWESPDTLAWSERRDHPVALKRGELVTGLPYAWAPLATMEQNREWLQSLHPEVTWKAPPKKQD